MAYRAHPKDNKEQIKDINKEYNKDNKDNKNNKLLIYPPIEDTNIKEVNLKN